MNGETLRLLILGAHPDDAEFHAGGLASIYRELGHVVKMVSVSNGAAGHHLIKPGELSAIRRLEAAASGAVIGAEYEVWNNPDGELQPTLSVRHEIIREIRTFKPDIVLTHRPNDYHPDHRAVGQAVQDACYMVTVPLAVPEVTALAKDPVVLYLPDRFTKPYPLSGDIVIDVTDCIDTIVQMLACHRSQFFEWLPYNEGILDEVPEEEDEKIAWLRRWYTSILRPMADRYRNEIISTYGAREKEIEYAEIYEIGEYASSIDKACHKRLFPFLP